MDTGLKQRLIGAAVLVALAVIFLPMLVKGPAPDSGVSDVPIKMPNGPEGDVETRELPLVMPGDVPKGGAVGMDTTPVDRPSTASTPATAASGGDPATASTGTDASVSSDPSSNALPATAAGGDYAVHFGAYATRKGADTVVALAKAAQLPAYSETATVNGKPAFRVRIGPYATRAEAEAVRLKALEVRSDVPVKVVTLDAEPALATASVVPAAATASAETPKPVVPKPSEPTSEAKPQPKPAEPKPVAVKPSEPKPAPVVKPPAPKPVAVPPTAAVRVGFAVQLGAFSDAAEAGAMRERLRAAGFTAFTETVNTDKGKLTRVRVGPVLDRAAADQLKSQIKAKTGVDGIVRPHP